MNKSKCCNAEANYRGIVQGEHRYFCEKCQKTCEIIKGLDYSKDNIYDALGRPDLKPTDQTRCKDICEDNMHTGYCQLSCWGLKMPYNDWRLGEGCLTEISKFAECLWQLLPNRCYVLGGLSALNLI
jgi:hypothetical protein